MNHAVLTIFSTNVAAIVPIDRRACVNCCSYSGIISISRGLFTLRSRGLIREKGGDRDGSSDVASDPKQDLLGPRNIVAR